MARGACRNLLRYSRLDVDDCGSNLNDRKDTGDAADRIYSKTGENTLTPNWDEVKALGISRRRGRSM